MSDFYQYSHVDDNGAAYGSIDLHDWKVSDQFDNATNALFNFTDTVNYTDAAAATVSLLVCPIPVNSIDNFFINTSSPTVMKMVIIDSVSAVVSQTAIHLNNGNSTLALAFPDSSYRRNATYRLLYKFYDSSRHNYASGHGDIKTQQ